MLANIEKPNLVHKDTLVFGAEQSAVPYLTFGVTDKCNLRCPYCCPNAENHGFEGQLNMQVDEMSEVGKAMYEQGVNVFRITGGEPTTWRPLNTLIGNLASLGDDVRINLNSNGTLPNVLLPIIRKYRQQLTLRVSIDSISPNGGSPKYLSEELTSTIMEAKDIVPTRINMVVTQDTLPELPLLLQKCQEMGVDLKLLDLYYNRDYLSGENKTVYWKKKFVPILATVEPVLKDAGFVFTNTYDDGGYGIPLPIYTDGSINVSVKDSTFGTRDHESCVGCEDNPCQEGLYSPMLSQSGVLHVSECRFEPFMFELNGKGISEKELAVRSMLNIFSQRKTRIRPADLVSEYMEK